MEGTGTEAFRLFGTIDIGREALVRSFAEVQQKAEGLAQRMSAGFQRAEKAIRLNRDAINQLGMGFAAMGGVIVGAAGMAVKAALEQERATDRLRASIAATGKAIDSAKLIRLAEDLAMVTRFTDEATEGMMAMLAGMGATEKQILALAPRAQNLAVIFGLDLDTAARAVFRTVLTGSAMALRRMGIILDESVVKSKDFDAILQEVDKHSRGAAEAMGRGADAIVILHNQIGELTEDIGALLLPKLSQWIEKGKGVVAWVREYIKEHPNFGAAMTGTAIEFGVVTAAVGALALAIPRVLLLFTGPVGWIAALAAFVIAVKEACEWLDRYREQLKKTPPPHPNWFERLLLQKQELPSPPPYGTAIAMGDRPSFGRLPPLMPDSQRAKAYGASLDQITAAYERMEAKAKAGLATREQEVVEVDRLIAAHRTFMISSGDGIKLLGTLLERSKALHKEMADDATQSAEKASTARKKEIEAAILQWETLIQAAELAGKKMAPEEIAAGWRRIGTRYQDLLVGVGTVAAKFPELHKEIQQKILAISRDSAQQQKQIDEKLEQDRRELGEARMRAVAEEHQRELALTQSLAEKRRQYLIETGQLTTRMQADQTSAQISALAAVIDMAKNAADHLGVSNAQLLEWENALLDAQMERHRLNVEITEEAQRQRDAWSAALENIMESWRKIAAQAKRVLTPWQQTMADIAKAGERTAEDIRRSFEGAIFNMMKGMGSFADFLQSVWDSILQYVSHVIAEIVIRWIAAQAKMKAAQAAAGGGGGLVGALIGGAVGFATGGPVGAAVGAAGGYAAQGYQSDGIITHPTHGSASGGVPGSVVFAPGSINVQLDPASLDALGVERLSDRLMRHIGRHVERRLLGARGMA